MGSAHLHSGSVLLGSAHGHSREAARDGGSGEGLTGGARRQAAGGRPTGGAHLSGGPAEGGKRERMPRVGTGKIPGARAREAQAGFERGSGA